jgi:hypothetical protein
MQTHLRPGRRALHFGFFRKLSSKRAERALHKAVRWSLAIANNDLHESEDPARGVDRGVVTLHAELPLTPLDLRHYHNPRQPEDTPLAAARPRRSALLLASLSPKLW